MYASVKLMVMVILLKTSVIIEASSRSLPKARSLPTCKINDCSGSSATPEIGCSSSEKEVVCISTSEKLLLPPEV